jgi:hypothetical protein
MMDNKTVYIIVVTIVFLLLLKIYDKKRSSKLMYISFIPIAFYIFQNYVIKLDTITVTKSMSIVKEPSSLPSLSSLISSF